MSILVNKNTRVLIQGITGTQASFHVKRSQDDGTNIVAGVSPNYERREYLDVPVYKTVREAVSGNAVDASVLFVPARFVKSAAKEAVEAEIPLIVSVSHGVPVHDMLEIKAMLKGSKTMMIGPNTPGIITPSEARLGIFPENINQKGCIGIVSRASTLTYEAVLETNKAGLGQSTVVGLGDDLIVGTDYPQIIEHFCNDDETKAIVLVGKPDNLYEQMAAEYYAKLKNKKPIIAFIAGEEMPLTPTMGYAVDIITHGLSTVRNKKEIMRKSGMIVVDRTSEIHTQLEQIFRK